MPNVKIAFVPQPLHDEKGDERPSFTADWPIVPRAGEYLYIEHGKIEGEVIRVIWLSALGVEIRFDPR